MTYLSILLGLIMLLFAGVQYNDPDGPLWVVIYGVPAAWAFLAAFKLPAVRSRTGTLLLWLTIALRSSESLLLAANTKLLAERHLVGGRGSP
jgi:hypothetical protein